MARIVLQHSGRIPEFLVLVAPFMDELISLRDANRELRQETYKPNAELASLLEGTPISVRQDEDGLWSSSINLADDFRTGTSGAKSAEDAFRTALNHVSFCWQQRERDHREAMGDDQ